MNGYLEEGKKIVWSRLVLLEEDAHSCAIINIVTIMITIVILIWASFCMAGILAVLWPFFFIDKPPCDQT